MAKSKIIYIVTPTGPVGGGMGRVSDYMMAADPAGTGLYRFETLSSRDERGTAWSFVLMLRVIFQIFLARITGRLALVHVQFADRGSSLRKGIIHLAAWAMGVRTVLHLHTWLKEAFEKGGPIYRFLIRLPFRSASSIVVLGASWRALLVDDFGIDPGKIDILYNGVPANAPPRDFLNSQKNTLRILFLGQLGDRKGTPELLQALAALPKDAPQWELVLAGNGEVERFRQMASDLGIGARCRFAGWVDQAGVSDNLAQADMLCLPSHNEVLPLVVLEAFGCGTPVITTPVGVMPELFENGREVLFVPPGDPAILSAMIARLLADATLRQHLADEGKAAYDRDFSLAAFHTGLDAIYRRRFGLCLPGKVAGA